ncbi:serpin B [Sporobacter termitidis DSM 10068]|uniref:Serpin B n=1 Tax=Sporobacter termitidis DSM 10068 TaxID=1123282 RepID=A0A1M5WYB1_9FIRM|nr:serpin family protein [Sporobacter termitidis]SHH92500.1 serpin B [Sporobacter termitidis DSM 10068]
MKKIITILLGVAALLLSGCAPASSAGTVDLMADIRPRQIAAEQAAADTTAFALKLLETVYDGGNTVVSPLSAYIALSMVANGAAGGTQKEFESVLGAPAEELNAGCKAFVEALNKSSDGLTLKTANGIWYNTAGDFKADQGFLQTNADYYSAAAVASDFSRQETVDDINNYISDNTNGLIQNMVDQLEPNDVMVLVNTLYFNGKWASPFDPVFTQSEAFVPADGKNVRIPTMCQIYDEARCFETEDARGILLPYVSDRFAYVALLPSGGVADYLAALTPESFKGLIASAADRRVELHIPKYTASISKALNEPLRQMGLQSAFDPLKADFSALGTAKNNIFIDNVLQNAVFKLDEQGTEAAAATKVELRSGSAPAEKDKPVVLRLDRPFIYALMDMQTGAPLFLGVLDNPELSD